MRGHAKDGRVSAKAYHSDPLPGIFMLVCDSCLSQLTFAAGLRPETCHMCGSAISDPETVTPGSFTKSQRSRESNDRLVAELAKRLIAQLAKRRMEGRQGG